MTKHRFHVCLETLCVVGGGVPAAGGVAVEVGVSRVAGARQLGDGGARQPRQGVARGGRPAQDRVIVPPATTSFTLYS